MTSELRPVVLVTRATGHAGTRILATLRRHGGFALRAMTHVPGSAAARVLAGDGVEIVRGDCDDFESLRHAMAGCYGVVAIASAPLQGTLDLVDAAADAGVGRVALVLDGTDRDTALASAATAEAYARAAAVPLVIIVAGRENAADAVATVFAR